nr:MAG TPA: hypothetical protein [Caudoviricetes sp.]
MANGSISLLHTGVICPVKSPPNGKPPEPSKRLPRVNCLFSISDLPFRLEGCYFLELQLLAVTDNKHIIVVTIAVFDIPLHDHIHELRVQLDAPAHTVGLLTGNQGRAAAEERIEDDAVGHSGISDGITHQANGLHGRMVLVGLRPVILPYSRLLPVGIPLVFPLLLPAVKTRLVLPLVRTVSQHQSILLPDTAPGQVEPGILECLSKVQPLGVSVEDIDGAIVCQMPVHLLECCQKELVEFRVTHIVVQNLAGRFFHIHVVRGIGKNQICLGSVHQGIVAFCLSGIAAQNDVLSQMPEVALFGEARLLQLGFHIKVIFLDLFAVDLVEQRLDLRRVKTRLSEIEIGILDVLEQVSQQRIIPCTRDLVECNVQSFFSGLVDVHHRARHFGVSQLHRYGQSLVTTDDRHIGIDHQRICETELRDRVLDFLILFIPRLQLLPGIVCGRLEYGHRQHL